MAVLPPSSFVRAPRFNYQGSGQFQANPSPVFPPALGANPLGSTTGGDAPSSGAGTVGPPRSGWPMANDSDCGRADASRRCGRRANHASNPKRGSNSADSHRGDCCAWNQSPKPEFSQPDTSDRQCPAGFHVLSARPNQRCGIWSGGGHPRRWHALERQWVAHGSNAVRLDADGRTWRRLQHHPV